jgi:NADH-quinone oxidoreductase subunit L
MIVPMVILAALASLGGYVGLPKFLGLGNAIDQFLHPVFAGSTVPPHAAEGVTTEIVLVAVSVLAVAVGFFAAYWIYVRHWGLAARVTRSAQWLYDLVYNKYYVDEAYAEAIVKPLRSLGVVLADSVEIRGIDGTVNGIARFVGTIGEGVRRLQTGMTRHYALAIFAGVVLVVGYFVVRSLVGV